MLSKTSFFHKTLFRKNLSRFWPMWGMVSFVGMLLPAAMLLNLGYTHMDGYEMTELYYNALVYVIPGISLVYAILCAMACWEYLYFPRNLSLMHTLPVKRDGIFVTNFLSGMAMMLIPYVVTGTMCAVVSLLFDCFELVGLLETILGVFGMSLFYFCSATFVAFLTGNIFMLPALYFLLHFLAPLMDFLCSTYASGFIYGISGNYSGVVDFLSPTVFIMKRMNIETLHEIVPDPNLPGEELGVIAGYDLHGLWIIGVYALVGLVLLALAWAMYRRRRSECAGDVIAAQGAKPIFRFGIAALAAMTGGLLLYMLLWHSVHEKTLMAAVPLAACMVIAGGIGYYAASMMLSKSLRVFRGSWKGMSVVVLFCVLLCAAFRLDLLGVGNRVPDVSEIQELTFRAADNTYIFEPDEEIENLELVEDVLSLHAALAADRAYIVDFLDGEYTVWETQPDGSTTIYYNGEPETDVSTYNSITFTYRLKNGVHFQRRYNVPISRSRLAQPDTYDAMVDMLVNSNTMRCKRLFMDRPEYEPQSGYVWMDFGTDKDFSLSDREAAALLAAVRTDALSGAWGTYLWFDNEYNSRYAMSLDLELRYRDENQSNHYENLHIYVRPGMKETIACLIDLGIVNSEEEMLTYSQIDFQRFCEILEDEIGILPWDMSQEQLRKYCLEYGYDFEEILRTLYGDEVLTSFPATSVSTQTVAIHPNSAPVPIYIN